MAKKGDEMVVDELEVGGEPRVYELGFHLDPELPSEEVKKAYGAVRSLIEERGALVAEGEPERIQLAYTISRQETAGRRDFDSAHFAWIAYETMAEKHQEIIAAVSADKRVIRFIDLITDKDSARHSLELREMRDKTPEPAMDAEEAAGVELDAALENVVI